MALLQLAFCDSDLIGAKAIKLLTWSDFCHVAILNGDLVLDSRLHRRGVSLSTYPDLRRAYKRIAVREYSIPLEEVWEAALTQIGKPYDLTAVLGLPLRRNWQEDDSWFCSEVVAWACAKAGTPLIHKEAWRVTPQDLWQAR